LFVDETQVMQRTTQSTGSIVKDAESTDGTPVPPIAMKPVQQTEETSTTTQIITTPRDIRLKGTQVDHNHLHGTPFYKTPTE
jgi:hypothetical protein